jgi:lipoprotein signal peptidase
MSNHESRITNHAKRIPAIVFAGVLFACDQAVKHAFSDSAPAYCNPVGSWGMSVDNGVLIGVMVVVLVIVTYFFLAGGSDNKDSSLSLSAFGGLGMTRKESLLYRIAFALLFSGGASNLLDRILFGCVRDFSLISWFPAFNLADVFLTIGAVLLLSMLAEKK